MTAKLTADEICRLLELERNATCGFHGFSTVPGSQPIKAILASIVMPSCSVV
jgi:hypothetical protein